MTGDNLRRSLKQSQPQMGAGSGHVRDTQRELRSRSPRHKAQSESGTQGDQNQPGGGTAVQRPPTVHPAQASTP